jgi:hypothetical protein
MVKDIMKLISGSRNAVVERCRKRIEEAKNNNNHKETKEETFGVTSILKRKHGL